jgi:hypothetical protein
MAQVGKVSEFLAEILLGTKSTKHSASSADQCGTDEPNRADPTLKLTRTLLRKLVVFAHHRDVMDAIQQT